MPIFDVYCDRVEITANTSFPQQEFITLSELESRSPVQVLQLIEERLNDFLKRNYNNLTYDEIYSKGWRDGTNNKDYILVP